MRVVVVGTGVMGLSAARVLAERGHDVVALDRHGVGSPQASSSGDTRIWRLAHPDRERVRLARRAVGLWRELEERCGQELLVQRGLLWRGGEALEVAAALAAEGVDHEVLDRAGQARLFPELVWQPDVPVVWQPEAGPILADRALAGCAGLARRAGVRLVGGETVDAVVQRPDGGVTVVSDKGSHDADCAVVTPGPWAAPFLEALELAIPLEPVLSQVSYFAGEVETWQQRPCMVDVPADASSFGTFAMPVPGLGYKVAIDDEIRPFDPTSTDRGISSDREREVVDWVRHHLPGLDPSVSHSAVCAWTSSPDDLFILDRRGDVVIGCGDSGQAFKFLPLFGPLIADLAEGRREDPDAAIFRADRFG